MRYARVVARSRGFVCQFALCKEIVPWMNATVVAAAGGSTNSGLHLPAIAHEAGIDFDLSRPITSRIVIRPSLVAETREAFARYESVLGKIVSQWSRNATDVTLDITIPPGSSATIYLPTNISESVRESGRPLHLATGIQSIAVEDGRVKCVAGSGEYHFLLPVNGMIPEN